MLFESGNKVVISVDYLGRSKTLDMLISTLFAEDTRNPAV